MAGVRNMVRQHVFIFEQLEVVEAMWTFISHRMSNGKELCAKLEWADNDLAIAQKVVAEGAEALKLAEGKKEMIDTEADKLRKEGKVLEAKLKKVEQENVELKKEMKELRTRLVA